MKGTPLTDQICEYIIDNFATEERAMLSRMAKRAEVVGVPMIMISEEQARFVGMFVRAIKAKRVLDVGTLFGYSAAIMAQAVGTDGHVVSLEFSNKHAEVAKENLQSEGMTNVEVITGPALDAMRMMQSDSFDFILIDADKINYINYLTESLRLVKNGGVIAGDNALAWGKVASDVPKDDEDYTSVTSIQAFNKTFARENAIYGVICAVGDGMAIGVVSK